MALSSTSKFAEVCQQSDLKVTLKPGNRNQLARTCTLHHGYEDMNPDVLCRWIVLTTQRMKSKLMTIPQ